MKRPGHTLAITVITLGGMVLSACGATTANTPHSSGQGNGNIVYALSPKAKVDWYLPVVPDPYDSAANNEAISLMYKGIYYESYDRTIDYSRSIASSITFNKAGTVYTVKMNPKWHWSDGKPVTAQDVLFTWKIIQYTSSKQASQPWPYDSVGVAGIPSNVASVKALNTHEFRITLKQPESQLFFLLNGVSDFVPMPSHAWDKYPTDIAKEVGYLTQNASNPKFFSVVDGPFRISAVNPNVSWTFDPNPSYDGHKSTLQHLVLAFEASDAAEFNALKAKTLDVGYLPTAMYGSHTQLDQADTLEPVYSFGINRVALNFRNDSVGAIFRQLYVRQAMQDGIDQAGIVHTVYHGAATPTYTFVPSEPKTVYLAPLSQISAYTYDPAKGKALLVAHGWHMVNGVMQNAAGQRLSFTGEFPSGSQTNQQMAEVLQADWAKEGIKITLKPEPYPALLHQHHQPQAWQVQMEMPFVYGGAFPSDQGLLTPTGGFNFYGYSDPQQTRLIDSVVAPHPTLQDEYQAEYASEAYAAHQLPFLFVPFAESYDEVASNLAGVVQKDSQGQVVGLQSAQYWSVK